MFSILLYSNKENKKFIELVEDESDLFRFIKYPSFYKEIINNGLNSFTKNKLGEYDTEEEGIEKLNIFISAFGLNNTKDNFNFKNNATKKEEVQIFNKDEWKNSKELKNWNGRTKPVVCLNTKQIFISAKEAANWCNLSSDTTIQDVCTQRKNRKTAGKDSKTGVGLRWMYLEDIQDINNIPDIAPILDKYIALRSEKDNSRSDGEKIIIKKSDFFTVHNIRPVVCKNDGKLYPSASFIAKYRLYGINNPSGISNCINGNKKTCGRDEYRLPCTWRAATEEEISMAIKEAQD